MAMSSKKDLLEKVRPLIDRLTRIQEALDELSDQVATLAEEIDEALDDLEE